MDLPTSSSQSQPSSFPQRSTFSYSHGQDSSAIDANTAANTHTNSHSQYDDSYHQSSTIHAPQPQLLSQQTGRFTEEWGAAQRGPSVLLDYPATSANMQRSNSVHSFITGDDQQLPSRSNTLKKKNSVRRNGSLKRSGSRRSMRAGSVRSLALQSSSDHDEAHSAFYCPVPTTGNPTDTLSNRFQNWRKVLKDLIAYFREIQAHYEHRSKSLLKLANVSNNITTPPGFLQSSGIDDALQFLRVYNKNAILEANKAKDIEEDVILALTGLRSDLQQKIKEIKNLSGDFKNSVDKEMDHTRKAVKTLSDILGRNELDEASTTGKQDPYLLRLAVDRQVERQLDEENYLHQAYLNLENSGRELEAIVVGEIQKAYNAYAGILKREADNSYSLIGELRDGPIAMPKDHEWMDFVTHDEKFVDPSIPLRTADQIHYPGQDHEAAQEIRAGLLERKSKYLKSYTAGWYVLSATHLHEFKTADKAQAPIMSLYLPEQKVGSHSNEGGSSNKFILKGRQTGGMHRGHTWVFRAESHDTMMAWYEDIKALTEKTLEERNQFVRSHSRSLSRSSRRSVSSDGLVDEEDEEPFTADTESFTNPGPRQHEATPRRSQAGGRFPSDIQVNAQRGLQAPHSPSSVSSGFQDNKDPVVPPIVTGALSGPAAGESEHQGYGTVHETPMDEMPSHAAIASQKAHYDGVNPYTSEPVHQTPIEPSPLNQQQQQYQPQYEPHQQQQPVQLSEYVDQHNDHSIAPVVVPQGKEERDGGFASTQQNHYDEKPNNYTMAPRKEPHGGYTVGGSGLQGSAYEQTSDDYPTYESQASYDNHANGGAKINNYTMTTVGEGFPRLDGAAAQEHQPLARQAESVYTERDSILLQTDDEDDTPAPMRPASKYRPLSFSSPTTTSQSVCSKLAPAVPSVGTLFAKFHTAKKKVFSIRLRGRPNPTNSNKHTSPGYKSNNQAQTSGRIAKSFHLSDLSQLATRRKTRSLCLSEEVRVDAAVADLVAVAVVAVVVSSSETWVLLLRSSRWASSFTPARARWSASPSTPRSPTSTPRSSSRTRRLSARSTRSSALSTRSSSPSSPPRASRPPLSRRATSSSSAPRSFCPSTSSCPSLSPRLVPPSPSALAAVAVVPVVVVAAASVLVAAAVEVSAEVAAAVVVSVAAEVAAEAVSPLVEVAVAAAVVSLEVVAAAASAVVADVVVSAVVADNLVTTMTTYRSLL